MGREERIGREGAEEDDGAEKEAIRGERLSIGRSDAENGGDDDVLEAGNEEESRVLGRRDVQLIRVDDRRNVPVQLIGSFTPTHNRRHDAPRLRSNVEEDSELHTGSDNDLANERRQDLLRDEVRRGSSRMDARIGIGAPHYVAREQRVTTAQGRERTRNGDWEDDDKVDVEELRAH